MRVRSEAVMDPVPAELAARRFRRRWDATDAQ
jgi:hypothetical protein